MGKTIVMILSFRVLEEVLTLYTIFILIRVKLETRILSLYFILCIVKGQPMDHVIVVFYEKKRTWVFVSKNLTILIKKDTSCSSDPCVSSFFILITKLGKKKKITFTNDNI